MTAELRPDYTKSWSTLFRKVCSHILGSTAVISVVEGKSQAAISDLGCALAWVTDCRPGEIVVESPRFGGTVGPGCLWEAIWHVTHELGRCKRGDILIYLQGARRPCIVRPCRDHFDIVIVSLPVPKDLDIVDLPDDEQEVSSDFFEPGWAALMKGARHARRKFTLIWDWPTESQHDHMSHVAQIESEPGNHPNSVQRCSNTARVLDDIGDHSALLELLQIWPRSANATLEGKHLLFLEHTCRLWEDYLEVKCYISELRLCIQALKAPINYPYVVEYWCDHGFLGPDLPGIVQMAKLIPESALESTVAFEPYVPILEPFQDPLIPILFPRYPPVRFKQQDQMSTKRTVSSHSGRYIMRLILANDTALIQPSDGTLDRLSKDPIMASLFPLIRGILTEHKTTHLDPAKLMQQVFGEKESVLKIQHLDYTLTEFSFDAALVYELLEYLSFFIDDWSISQINAIRVRIMQPSVDIFVRHLTRALCDLEFGSRATAPKSLHSVSSFLYTAYLPGDITPCSEVSKHTHALPFSVAQKAEWAHKAILTAICALKRELRRDDASSSDEEESF